MGMRSGESRESAPGMLRLAAGVQAVEAAGLCVAGVLSAVDAAGGRSSQSSSGIALTLLAFVVAAGLAAIAAGVARGEVRRQQPPAQSSIVSPSLS